MTRLLPLSSILALAQVCSAQATFPPTISILPTKIGTSRDVSVSVIVTGSGLYVSGASSDAQLNPVPLTRVAAGSNSVAIHYAPTQGGPFSATFTWGVYKAQGLSSDPALIATVASTVTSIANDNTFLATSSPGVLGEPVSTATGELFEPALPADLAPGGPLGLCFRRYYASFLRVNGITTSLGNNWTHNFEYRLVNSGDSTTVVAPGGRLISFLPISGGWLAAGGEKLGYQFASGPGSSHQFLDPSDNRIYTFAADGTLSRIEDRNGNALTISTGGGFTLIADGLGRSLGLTYDGSGHLTRVQDQSGRSVSFAYTGDDLTQVTNANGKAESYTYTATGIWTGLMTTHTRPAGNKPFTQVFDSSGRVVRQSDSRGNATTLSYDPSGTTTFASPLGIAASHLNQGFYKLMKYTDPDGASAAFTYDVNLRRTSNIDRFGDKTSVTYHNPSGYISTETDAAGNTTTYTYTVQIQGAFTFYNLTQVRYADSTTINYSYDSFGNRVTVTDQAGKVARFSYNGRGQVLTKTNPVGGVITYNYNPDATLSSKQDAAGNTTTYIYDDKKRVAQIRYADNSTRAFTYDNQDRLVGSVDERGGRVAFSYDDNGNLKSTADAVFSYNGDDRLTSRTDRVGKSTTFAYDENGLPKTLVNPVGEALTYSHDTHNRLASVLDPAGKGLGVSYDAEDVPTSVQDALGRVWSFTTDKLGRTTRLTTPQSENYDTTYNRAGKIVARRNPLGKIVNFTYDPRGLLSRVSLPAGISASYTRNDLGLITGITDPNGKIWSNKFDAAGRLVSSADPLSRVTSYSYDSRDRLSSVTTPVGSANLTYDAAGNLLQKVYSDGTEFDYAYDTNTRLLTGNGLTLGYDANGRITSSNGLAIARDGAGRITGITYAPGKTVTYTYNFRGLPAAVTDWIGGETDLTYDDAQQLVSVVRPNGVSTSYGYDNNGRLASISESAGSSIVITRDAAGQVVSTDRNVPQAPQLAPGSLALRYDAAQQISGATYDGMGRLTGDGLRTYTWDMGSRLTGYSGSDGAASSTYDALGSRTSRNGENYTINYTLGAPSIATAGNASGDERYYVYLPSGTLLYSIEAADNSRRFFHFDEMGSTVMLTDDKGAITDSYGVTPDGESATQSGSTTNPFTWLGAYGVMQEDSTSLFYIRGRYYDSASARFLSPERGEGVDPRNSGGYSFTGLRGGGANPAMRMLESIGMFLPPGPAGRTACATRGSLRTFGNLDPVKPGDCPTQPALQQKLQEILER